MTRINESGPEQQTMRDQSGNVGQRMRQWGDAAREQGRRPGAHREGGMAHIIEEQTARLPSDTFLWTAGGCIAISLGLKIMGRDTDALFVGQWAPTFLILGLYNKIVKVAGHDGHQSGGS